MSCLFDIPSLMVSDSTRHPLSPETSRRTSILSTSRLVALYPFEMMTSMNFAFFSEVHFPLSCPPPSFSFLDLLSGVVEVDLTWDMAFWGVTGS